MAAIDNKIAIVTGGGGGIGGAIARRFAREGAKLAVADIDSSQLRRLGAEARPRARPSLALTIESPTNNRSRHGPSDARPMEAYRYPRQCRRRRDRNP